MDHSLISPKRRQLDNPLKESGRQNYQNGTLLDKESNVQKNGCSKCEKEIKWNFIQVRPEFLQCYHHIVESCKGPRKNANNTCEKTIKQSPRNDQMCSNKETSDLKLEWKRKLYSPDCTKQGIDPKTIPTRSMLSTSGPKLVEPRDFMQGSPRSLKRRDEKSDGGWAEDEDNQAALQQGPSKELIPSSLNKDNIRYEIQKFVKQRSREILGETEKLRTRVSSLETENRNLKHKVKMLYKAIREALNRQKETLTTVVRSTSTQREPHKKATENGFVGSSLPETLVEDVVLESEQSTLSFKETSEATNNKRSIGGDFQSSISSLSDKTLFLSNHLPKMALTPVQTSSRKDVFQDYEPLSSVRTQPLSVLSSSTNGSTSHKRTPVLKEVLHQIFLDSSTALLEKRPHRPPPCTSTTVPLTRTNTEENGGIVGAVTSLNSCLPNKRHSRRSSLNADQKTAPETSKVEEKTERFFADTCHVTIANEKGSTSKTASLLTNNRKSDCNAFAKTLITCAEGQPKQKCEPFKMAINSTRFLGNSCEATSDGADIETSKTSSTKKNFFEAFVNTPPSNSEQKPKPYSPPSSANYLKFSSVFKADDKHRMSLQTSTSLVTTAGVTGTSSTVSDNANTCKNQFSDSKTQSNIVFSTSSASFLSKLSPTTLVGGQDENSSITSRCLSVVSSSTSPRDQSPGLLTGISMLAKAAGLGTNTASQATRPTQPSIPSSGSINTLKKGNEESKSNLQNVNITVGVENSESLKTNRMTNRSALAPSSLPQLSNASSSSKHQTMPYRHATQWENPNFLPLATFYNGREHRPQHKPGQTWVPSPVVTKPRYHPNRPVRANGHLHSLVQPSRKRYMEFESRRNKDVHRNLARSSSSIPVSSQNGCESHVQFNSTLTSSSLNLMQPLQPSHHLHFSMKANGSEEQDNILNTKTSPNKSPGSDKRGFSLHPQNHGQHINDVTKESWIYNNCPAMSSRASPVMEDAPKHSSKRLYSQEDSNCKPRLEMSQPCRVYLNQLRKFKEAPAIPAEDSINAGRPSLNNSEPQSKRQKIDGIDGCQGNSGKLQPQGCSDHQLFDPQASPAKRDWKYQKASRLFFHHRKFTTPPQRHQGYLCETWLRPTQCQSSSEAK